jgi:hypothetical protein
MHRLIKQCFTAGVVGLVLASSLLLSACASNQFPNQVSTPSPAVSPSSVQPLQLKRPAVLPLVDGTEIFRHVEALSFERYEAIDRARAREYLTRTLRRYGWAVQPQPFNNGNNDGVNLVATLNQAETAQGTLLVVAHYDTVAGSPGADDNASSLAVALEVARLFRDRPTSRRLQFAFFDLEERGLQGSLAYTALPENLADLAGVVNLEMLGYACYTPGCQRYPEGLPIVASRNQGDFLGIAGDQEHLPLLQAFQLATTDTLPPILTLAIPFKGLLTPDVLRSDHAPFWAKSIGAVIVSDTANFRNPHYHQPTDTPDRLDRPFLAGAAQLTVNAIATLLASRGSLATP